LGLPKHRMTPETFHHAAYSKKVRGLLDKVFLKFKKAVEKHEVPDYESCRSAVEAISTTLYPQIVSAGELMKAGKMVGDALDDIPAAHFGL
jgi:hypothetical protein